MADGSTEPIERVKAGDWVKSRNPKYWTRIRPIIPLRFRRASWTGAPPARPEVVYAIRYVTRNGCAWRNLPHDLPP